MLKLFRTKIAFALLLLLLIFFIGVIGYRMISDYTWVEAIYMTIITVTTVGFSEVKPLGTEAKMFTVFLIITSVFIIGYAVSVITEFLIEKNSLQNLKKRKVQGKIKKLDNHVVVCGFGRNGQQAADRLMAYKQPFVVIEKDKETVEKFMERILFVEGDANDDEVLKLAGIERAKFLITAIPDDAANLFVVLSSKQLNSNLYVISRASSINSISKLEFAGADKVIMPDKIGGDHMAAQVVMPDLITFMDKLSMEGEHTTNLEEVEISDFADQVDCGSLRQLDLRRRTGCTIIGYIEPNGNYIINPEADQKLESDGKVIVLGRPEQIQKLNRMFLSD